MHEEPCMSISPSPLGCSSNIPRCRQTCLTRVRLDDCRASPDKRAWCTFGSQTRARVSGVARCAPVRGGTCRHGACTWHIANHCLMLSLIMCLADGPPQGQMSPRGGGADRRQTTRTLAAPPKATHSPLVASSDRAATLRLAGPCGRRVRRGIEPADERRCKERQRTPELNRRSPSSCARES